MSLPLTNAERQRRYIARLKAAATDRHLAEEWWLKQENATLRRKIAKLERAIADAKKRQK